MDLITRDEAIKRGLTSYFTGKPCNYGHVAQRRTKSTTCCECQKKFNKKYKSTEKGKTANARADKNYREKYPEKCKERDDKKNKEYIENGNWAAYYKSRMENDVQFRAKELIRCRINLALKNNKTRDKSGPTIELLGASVKDVLSHIERQFQPGMNWDNWTVDGWHLDHIRPCASFDLTDPEHQRECFHFSNLQPLWAADNIRKGDKWKAA